MCVYHTPHVLVYKGMYLWRGHVSVEPLPPTTAAARAEAMRRRRQRPPPPAARRSSQLCVHRLRNVDGSRESTRDLVPFLSFSTSLKIHPDADPHKRATNAWSNTGTHIAAALPASLEAGCATRERQVPLSFRPRGKAGARGRGGAVHAALPELSEPHRRGGRGPRAPRRRRRATPPQPCP